MKKHLRFLNISNSAVVCLLTSTLVVAAPTDPQVLHQQINTLSNTLDNTKDQYDKMESEVTRLEKQLGTLAQNQRKTQLKIQEAQTRLRTHNTKSEALERDLDAQKSGLAQQLQALYTEGGQSHLRLLLRQDNPADISRNLHYFEYLNKHRTQRIQKLKKTHIEALSQREAAERERQSLDSLAATLTQQEKELQNTLDTREKALGITKSSLRDQQRQLNQLKEQETALQNKLESLAQEREKKAQQAEQSPTTTATATEERRSQSAATPNTSALPETPTRSDDPSLVSYSKNFPFTRLKGKLAWPTSGKILHAYRSRKNEKQSWSGVVIQANGGSAVRSIAAGRVAYSGWMNGYGHLIIVEHDRNYISLYGYNRAVYKREGQLIKANEMIAAVGNSGGQAQNGLYFEIRKGTTPLNPAMWCR